MPKVAYWINRKRRVSLLLWTFCLSLTVFVPTLGCYITFWLLNNTDLNQRPIVSWPSTTKFWQQWDWKKKYIWGNTRYVNLINHKCLLTCWGSILLSPVLKTRVKMKLTKKFPIIKEGKMQKKRLKTS